jgi:hypothetical protein
MKNKLVIKKNLFLAVWPLMFFMTRLYGYYEIGETQKIFWHCNVVNLMLVLGLIFEKSELIWLSTISLMVGNFIWISDLLTGGNFETISLLTHLGSCVIGIIACHYYPHKKTSRLALLYTVNLILISYHFTSPIFNINLAFSTPLIFRPYVDSHLLFILIWIALVNFVYFLAEKMLILSVSKRASINN